MPLSSCNKEPENSKLRMGLVTIMLSRTRKKWINRVDWCHYTFQFQHAPQCLSNKVSSHLLAFPFSFHSSSIHPPVSSSSLTTPSHHLWSIWLLILRKGHQTRHKVSESLALVCTHSCMPISPLLIPTCLHLIGDHFFLIFEGFAIWSNPPLVSCNATSSLALYTLN